MTERQLRDLARRWPDPDDQLAELERMAGVKLERDGDAAPFAVAG